MNSTEIQITEIKDFTIWGAWSGDQSEALKMIQALPEFAKAGPFHRIPELYSSGGTAAGDNTFEGTFSAGTRENDRH